MNRADPKAEPERLRIVSYNIHACVGRDRRFMPGRIAEVLADLDADFIALQEVEDRIHRGRTVSEYLAESLGMQAYRGTTLHRGDARYGNLLLAREAATGHRLHDISVPGREPRGAIEADFAVGGRTLRLFVTHLGLQAAERRRQLRHLLPALERDDVDVRVLAGDLNEWRPAAVANRLLANTLGSLPRPRTFPAVAPMLALDRICVAPAEAVLGLQTVATPRARQASDHLPLMAQVRPFSGQA